MDYLAYRGSEEDEEENEENKRWARRSGEWGELRV